MNVNASVYPTKYYITGGSGLTGNGFECTYSIEDLLTGGYLEQGKAMDNSNVYTTINPLVNDLQHVGTRPSTMFFEPLTEAPGTMFIPTSIVPQKSEPQYVNMRLGVYLVNDNNSSVPGKQGGIFAMTGLDGHDITEAVDVSLEYNQASSWRSNFPTQVGSISRVGFLNKVKFSEMLMFVNGFWFYNPNSYATEAVGWDRIKPQDNTPAGDLYTEELWETGKLADGRFLVGIGNCSFFFGNNTKAEETLKNRSEGLNFYESNAEGMFSRAGFIVPVIETVSNGKVMYSMLPYMNYEGYNGALWYNGWAYTFLSTGFYSQAAYSFTPCPYFCNSLLTTIKGDNNLQELNTLYTPFYYDGCGDLQLMQAPDGLGALVDGTNFFYTKNRDRQNDFNVFTPVLSLKQALQVLACTLIPFTFDRASVNASIQECDNDNIYIGITDENEMAIGEWVQGTEVANQSRVQGDFIPEGFEPVDPENPPKPEIDEDDFGDIPLNLNVSLGASNAFVSNYLVNSAHVRIMGKELWSNLLNDDTSVLENFYKVFAGDYEQTFSLSNVIDYFVSLKYYPIKNMAAMIDCTPFRENGISVGTGAATLRTGTNAEHPKLVNNPIVILDGGTCIVGDGRLMDNFLDHEPVVSCSIYVPYCGTADLVPSQVMGATLNIKYAIDLITGDMTAYVMKSGKADFPVAVLNGTIGFDILMTGSNASSQTAKAITTAKSTMASIPFQIGAGALGGISGGEMGMALGAAAGAVSATGSVLNTAVQFPAMMATSPLTSGTSSSFSALVAPQTAFVQVARRKPVDNNNYAENYGLVSERPVFVQNVKGFAVFVNPRLEDIPCTAEELNMIDKFLTSGIFVTPL